MKVLYITANPKNIEHSHSLSVGDSFIKEYQKQNKDDEVILLDLFKTDVPEIDYDVMNAWGKLASGVDFKDLSTEEIRKISSMNNNLEQFMDADKYVFVAPLWNFGVPPVLKAYIDNLAINGKTFKYTENGPKGLLGNKKALFIQSSGGVYSNEAMKKYEHGSSYMNVVLNFFGINDISELLVEGVNMAKDGGLEIREQFNKKAVTLAKTF
jgi:FMN-dependent NADH-azoreductase